MPGMACIAALSGAGGVKTGIGIVVMGSGDVWAGTAGGGAGARAGAVAVSGRAWDCLRSDSAGPGGGRMGGGAGRV